MYFATSRVSHNPLRKAPKANTPPQISSPMLAALSCIAKVTHTTTFLNGHCCAVPKKAIPFHPSQDMQSKIKKLIPALRIHPRFDAHVAIRHAARAMLCSCSMQCNAMRFSIWKRYLSADAFCECILRDVRTAYHPYTLRMLLE